MKNTKYKKKYYSLLIAILLLPQQPNINAATKLKTYDPELCMCEGQKVRTWLLVFKKLKDENFCGCEIDGMVGLYDNLVCNLIKDLKARNNGFLKDLLKDHKLYSGKETTETVILGNNRIKNWFDNKFFNNEFDQNPMTIINDVEKAQLEIKKFNYEQYLKPLKLQGKQFVNFLLLDGEPGTGKTEIANKIKDITGCNFFELDGASIVGKHFGDGPAAIEKKFFDAIEKANETGKVSIIFFDEIHEIASKDVGSHNKEPHTSALIKLKTLISKYENDPRICVVATTNHFEDFEKSIKSRFENCDVKVILPSTKVIKHFVEKFFVDNQIENIPAGVIDKIVNKIQKTSIRAIQLGLREGLENYKLNDFAFDVEKIHADLNEFASEIANHIKGGESEWEKKVKAFGNGALGVGKEVGMFVAKDIGAKLVFEGVVFVLKLYPKLAPVADALEQWRPKTVIEKVINNNYFGDSKSDKPGVKGVYSKPDSSSGA